MEPVDEHRTGNFAGAGCNLDVFSAEMTVENGAGRIEEVG
jgi:hypothetical protein